MPQARTVTVTVSTELADQFEAHAHLLHPATLAGKAPARDPFRITYYLHCPDAPQGAASVVPTFQSTEQGVRLLCLEWYDTHHRPLPAPAAACPPAHGTAH